MKKLYVLVLSLLLMAALAACGGNDAPAATPTPTPTPTPTATPTPTPAEETQDDNDADPVGDETSQIIGEWHMTSTGDPINAFGLENGWGYDIYFLENGTGIEWWNSPDTGWHEVTNFTWSAGNGQITITYIGIDIDVIDHYLGSEVGDLMEHAIGIPVTGTYRLDGNALTLSLGGTTHVYQRNSAAASQPIGEWHMVSTDDPTHAWGLENGWGYDIYFLENGTGIEWWNSPDTGWHEVTNFTWSVNNGQITMIYTGIDIDVIDHYLGSEVGDLMEHAIGIPIVGTYSVGGNALTMVVAGVTYVYHRN